MAHNIRLTSKKWLNDTNDAYFEFSDKSIYNSNGDPAGGLLNLHRMPQGYLRVSVYNMDDCFVLVKQDKLELPGIVVDGGMEMQVMEKLYADEPLQNGQETRLHEHEVSFALHLVEKGLVQGDSEYLMYFTLTRAGLYAMEQHAERMKAYVIEVIE